MSKGSMYDRISNIPLPRELKKTVKLSIEDIEQIRKMYFVDKMGIREIARHFEHKCTRRTIQFKLFPERELQMRKNRDWKKYHDRKKLTQLVLSLRKRKQEYYKKGLLELK